MTHDVVTNAPYLSPHFRSPLNVVHVGLEMLLTVINNSDPTSPVITIDRSTADFIKDMFFSSESAINLLNDLLQYEHIEAGKNPTTYVQL
jgi:signal transduction histidine kinase